MWRGTGGGGGDPEKSRQDVYRRREKRGGSRIPKVMESKRKSEKLCNIMQYFAIEKMQRGRSQQIQGGNRD